MSDSRPSMRDLFRRQYELEKTLWSLYKLRDQGGCAVRLVAEALDASVLPSGVNKGFDLEHPNYGRIEVRSRRKPLDEREEFRIDISKKIGFFDYLAHITFDSDYTALTAYLIPHDSIINLFQTSGRRYVRLDQ